MSFNSYSNSTGYVSGRSVLRQSISVSCFHFCILTSQSTRLNLFLFWHGPCETKFKDVQTTGRTSHGSVCVCGSALHVTAWVEEKKLPYLDVIRCQASFHVTGLLLGRWGGRLVGRREVRPVGGEEKKNRVTPSTQRELSYSSVLSTPCLDGRLSARLYSSLSRFNPALSMFLTGRLRGNNENKNTKSWK